MDGKKYDEGKLRWDLMPELAEQEVVKVLTHGSLKYDDENWRKVFPLKQRYYAAMRRHISKWRLGKRYDEDSKTHHLACAICSLIFILQTELEEDDASCKKQPYIPGGY
jgi:hypothetical protein